MGLENVDDLDAVRDPGVGVEGRNGSRLLEEALAADDGRVKREGKGRLFVGGTSSTAGGARPSSV